jgi:hypothetical protein
MINPGNQDEESQARIEAELDEVDDALWDAIAVRFPGHVLAYERREDSECLADVHRRSYAWTRATLTAFVEQTSALL